MRPLLACIHCLRKKKEKNCGTIFGSKEDKTAHIQTLFAAKQLFKVHVIHMSSPLFIASLIRNNVVFCLPIKMPEKIS